MIIHSTFKKSLSSSSSTLSKVPTWQASTGLPISFVFLYGQQPQRCYAW